MKNVTIIGILAASSLFTGCRSTPTPQSATPLSATPQSATPQSAINKVRNGYLKYNQTTTIGQALAGTFQNGEWKSFTTKKGATIVEFDGSEPFSENFAFAPAVKMIDDYCNSDAGKALYSKDQSSYDAQKAQIAQLKQQKSDLYTQIDKIRETPSKIKVSSSSTIPVAEQFEQAKKESDLKDQEINELSKKAGELGTQEMQLSNQLYSASDGHSSCLEGTYKQHAHDPIPVVVQFSINQDGTTFQYEANDMGLSTEALFEKIYK
jgi:hypothetical protein